MESPSEYDLLVGERPLGCPSSGVDLWADEVLADPYPVFAALREIGPVVWLERHGVVALPRFEQVYAALADWRRFSSARGVGMDDELNSFLGENPIASDPPAHDQYRKPLVDQLWPEALAPFIPAVQATATRFAEQTARAGRVDAVADLCRPYSLTVVADLLGLPEDRRDDYPSLAERAFNVFGPASDRATDGFQAAAEIVSRAMESAEPGGLIPGRRGEQLWEIGMPGLIVSYTWPGIDTTVNALASGVLLFAEHPELWADLRADRSLIPSAFNEVLRLHSPVHFFTRYVNEDVTVAGVPLTVGTRVLLMYGSANRDERRFENPDAFDIRRNGPSHVAFGRGVHLCAGMHLARIEAHSLLDALADRVSRFELAGEPRWTVNNTLHGLAALPVHASPAEREPGTAT
jgi:cytochrome P450